MHPQLLKFINFDFDNVIKSYEDAWKYNKKILGHANQDVLNILLCHDQDPKGRKEFLKIADNLIYWIRQHNTDKKTEWIYIVNSIQIEKRIKGTISEESKNKLYQISDSIQEIDAKWAVSVLLEESHRSKKYWNELDDKQKQLLIKMPIYNLYKRLVAE